MLKNYVLYFINTVKDVALTLEAQEPVRSKSYFYTFSFLGCDFFL